MIFYQDIRIVLWTGKEFSFLGEEDFRQEKDSKTIGPLNLYGDKFSIKKDTNFYKMKPVICTVSNSLDGTGTASLTFVSSDFPIRKVSGRQLFNRRDIFIKNNRLEYYNSFFDSFIKPYRFQYKKIAPFDLEDTISSAGLLSKTEPISIFQPPQIIWIMLRTSKESDQWFRVFTGIVDNISDRETSGKDHLIILRASNMIQVLTKISMVTKKISSLGKEAILESYPEEVRSFLKVYFATVFCNKGLTSFDALGGIKWTMLIHRIAKLVNRAFGALDSKIDKEEFYKEIKDPEIQQLLSEGGYGLPTEEDVNTFFDISKKYGFYQFKLVNDIQLEESDSGKLYEGNELRVPDTMSISDLFSGQIKDSKVPYISDIQFNDIILYLENNVGSTISSFRKLMVPVIKTFEIPEYATVSNFVRKFVSSFKFRFHTDGTGTWITEYPKYNNFPRIREVRSNFEFMTDKSVDYIDNNERYIFQKFEDIISFSETTQPEKRYNNIQIPFNWHQVLLPAPVENLDYTARCIDLESILLTGLNEISTEIFYSDVGVLIPKDRGLKFFKNFAELYMITLNEEVFSGNLELKLRPFLQVGRNALIVHKERVWLIKEVTHNFVSGKIGTTTLSLTFGRPLS